MATVKWNQDINAGQDWFVDFNILNDDNTPRDITGQTFEGLVKRHYSSVGSVPITLIVVNSVTGNVTMSLTSTQTSLLKGGKYLYDVEMTKAIDGVKERVIQGVITIRPEITVT